MDVASNSGRQAAVLPVICLALFLSVLNASALGVMLPDIAADLSVDTGQLSWVMTGFLLVFGIAIPFYGRLADRYGAKPMFILGLTIFPIGSLVCALAPSLEVLLLGRIIQAAGGAAIPGLGMTLASRAYGPESRGKALGILAATIGAGSAAGRCWAAYWQRRWAGNPSFTSTPAQFCWFQLRCRFCHPTNHALPAAWTSGAGQRWEWW